MANQLIPVLIVRSIITLDVSRYINFCGCIPESRYLSVTPLNSSFHAGLIMREG